MCVVKMPGREDAGVSVLMKLIGRGSWPGLLRCDHIDGVMGTGKEDAMSMRWSKTER